MLLSYHIKSPIKRTSKSITPKSREKSCRGYVVYSAACACTRTREIKALGNVGVTLKSYNAAPLPGKSSVRQGIQTETGIIASPSCGTSLL